MPPDSDIGMSLNLLQMSSLLASLSYIVLYKMYTEQLYKKTNKKLTVFKISLNVVLGPSQS